MHGQIKEEIHVICRNFTSKRKFLSSEDVSPAVRQKSVSLSVDFVSERASKKKVSVWHKDVLSRAFEHQIERGAFCCRVTYLKASLPRTVDMAKKEEAATR